MALMRNARHVWKDNAEFKGKADAEQVQQEINLIASNDPNGKCRNEDLVDFARNHPLSETHKCFDWNDSTAAEKYRLHQASRIKCSIITVAAPASSSKKNNAAKPVQVEVITNHSLPTPGNGHKDIQVILSNKQDMAALDKEMYDNLRVYVANFKKRFVLAPSSANVIQQLDAIVATLP